MLIQIPDKEFGVFYICCSYIYITPNQWDQLGRNYGIITQKGKTDAETYDMVYFKVFKVNTAL